jgi:hypothetical protein
MQAVGLTCFIWIVAGIGIVASPTKRDSEAVTVHAEVELDIFSGRPNPKWILTDAEAASFASTLQALPRISGGQPPGNLGYRGFLVLMTQGTDSQLFRVHRGIVYRLHGNHDAEAQDANRQLERWLLNGAKGHVENDLLLVVERDFR